MYEGQGDRDEIYRTTRTDDIICGLECVCVAQRGDGTGSVIVEEPGLKPGNSCTRVNQSSGTSHFFISFSMPNARFIVAHAYAYCWPNPRFQDKLIRPEVRYGQKIGLDIRSPS